MSELAPPQQSAARARRSLALAGAVALASLASTLPAHANLPEIRITDHNHVPACATPDRLMAFLRRRNGGLDHRLYGIASLYRRHGETWRVRWDYAFFQMIVETNYLSFRAPAGNWGDVRPRQNNFAGIGATGGGVPGDSFPDVSTGVLAQIQHLVVYSGERIAEPTAPRTRLKMDEILGKSLALGRPVGYHDLAGRWAADRAYGHSIESVAQAFRSTFCSGRAEPALHAGVPRHWRDRIVARWSHETVTDYDDDMPGRSARMPDDRAGGRARGPAPPRPAARRPAAAAVRTIDDTKAAVEGAAEKPRIAVVTPKQPAAPPPMATAPAPDAAATPAPAPPAAQSDVPARRAAAAPPPPAAPRPPAAPQPPAVTGTVTPSPRPACKIYRASYGGPKTVLIASPGEQGMTNYTALEVTTGREQDQTKAYMAAHAKDGKVIGEFATEADALRKSFELCPEAGKP